MLWSQLAEADGRDGGMDTVVGEPAVGDLDGDGVSDFVITTASAAWRDQIELFSAELQDDMTEKDSNRYRRAVVAISGRTGSGLWRYTVDPKGPTLVPAALVLSQPAVLVPRSAIHIGRLCRWNEMARARAGNREAASRADRAGVDSGTDPSISRPGWRWRARAPGSGTRPRCRAGQAQSGFDQGPSGAVGAACGSGI